MGALLRGIVSFVVRMFHRAPPAAATPPVAQPVRRVDAGLYIAFTFLVAGITLGFLHSGAWVFGGIAGALAVIAGTMMEVTEPDRAAYMFMGRYIGPLDPGWHFPISGIMECCHRPGKDIELHLEKQSVYTAQETDITAEVLVIIRLGSEDEDLKNASLRLPKDFDEAVSMFKKTAASEIRSVLGKKSFEHLIPEQEELELTACELLADDFKQYGFQVVGVKIYNIDEETKSEAARIKIQGLAEAEVRKANAAVLKDNWQAAAVTIGDSLARAYSGGGKSKKKSPQSQQEQSEDATGDANAQNPVSAVVQSVADAARGLAGGRRRRP